MLQRRQQPLSVLRVVAAARGVDDQIAQPLDAARALRDVALDGVSAHQLGAAVFHGTFKLRSALLQRECARAYASLLARTRAVASTPPNCPTMHASMRHLAPGPFA